MELGAGVSESAGAGAAIPVGEQRAGLDTESILSQPWLWNLTPGTESPLWLRLWRSVASPRPRHHHYPQHEQIPGTQEDASTQREICKIKHAINLHHGDTL